MMTKLGNQCLNETGFFVLITLCPIAVRETVCHTILGMRFVEY